MILYYYGDSMRMDRYSDEVLSVETKTRTNKNQELYTDVYIIIFQLQQK